MFTLETLMIFSRKSRNSGESPGEFLKMISSSESKLDLIELAFDFACLCEGLPLRPSVDVMFFICTYLEFTILSSGSLSRTETIFLSGEEFLPKCYSNPFNSEGVALMLLLVRFERQVA